MADPDHSQAILQPTSLHVQSSAESEALSLLARAIRMLGRSSTGLARHLCLFTSSSRLVRPHSSRVSAAAAFTSLNMASSSMHEALARIQSLERQLACAENLLKKYAARNLSDELVQAGLGPLTLPPSATEDEKVMGEPAVNGNENEHVDSSSSAVEESKASTATTASAATLDLGPLILRALEIRKQVHAGSLSEERAVANLDEIITQHSLSEEQASTLRAWAGQ